MNSIVNDIAITFKELEQKIFELVCEIGRDITKTILESYDQQLLHSRDKEVLRCKGLRKTTIKTVYGEVGYSRNVYQGKDSEGHKIFTYLLDEAMGMDKIGLISVNLAEKIANSVTENPYRVAADLVSSTCGQSVSSGGVWNLMQSLGERIAKEEIQHVEEMNNDTSKGTRETKLLFEEMDGVWLKMQDNNHKKRAKQEMKVAIFYEGWEEKNPHRLANKKVLAGMEKSDEFHHKREAQIHQYYDADEIEIRILNGDGGSWIKDPYEPETVFQLDRFHIYQDIKRKIKNPKAREEIETLLESRKIEEMFDFIETYATSIESPDEADKGSDNARKLKSYLWNNRKGLIPWQEQRAEYPKAPKGIIYKNMGVQENQNCTTITMRMKGNRRRWSVNGANNMAKVLYRKENKELYSTIEHYNEGLFVETEIPEILRGFSAAKAPKKEGKGNAYIDAISHHFPMLDALQTESRKIFRKIFT